MSTRHVRAIADEALAALRLRVRDWRQPRRPPALTREQLALEMAVAWPMPRRYRLTQRADPLKAHRTRSRAWLTYMAARKVPTDGVGCRWSVRTQRAGFTVSA